MAGGAISLRVLTDTGLAIEDQAVAIRAPGALGSFGILRNHAPLITTLEPGRLTWRLPDGQARAAKIGEGLLEITHNRCTILTRSIQEIR